MVDAHRGYAARVEAELRRFGRRKPRFISAVNGIDALTERERLIAELISAGKDQPAHRDGLLPE